MAGGMGRQDGLRHELKQNVRVDPRLVVQGQLMQLSQAELDAAIERELNENPALERLEEPHDSPTQDEVLRAVAPRELRPASEDREMARSLSIDPDSEVDWTELASSMDSLADTVLGQLEVTAPPRLMGLLAFYVGSLNERGYLEVTVEEAALHCGTSLEEAEAALAYLHACQPAGVGARDLRECLVIQLRSASTDAERLAHDLVATAWNLLVRRSAKSVARRFKVTPELAEEAFHVVTTLQPYPADGFGGSSRPDLRRATVRPDLQLRLTDAGWSVEVSGPSASSLCLNRFYRARLEELRGSRATSHERRHLSEYLSRAENFLHALEQRRRTMQLIGEYLIEHQDGYVRTGDVRFLKPLTRAQIAAAISVHESTVSRATSKKYLQIATGEVVAFEVLFKPALRIQQRIAEIVANEHPDQPMSDALIAQRLAEQGIHVARRTVNKYRDKCRTLSSRRRKTA